MAELVEHAGLVALLGGAVVASADDERVLAESEVIKRIEESDPNHPAARDHIGTAFYGMARQAFETGDLSESVRLSNIVRSSCSRYEEARELAERAAYRNVLSPNLPFFRREALELLAELESE